MATPAVIAVAITGSIPTKANNPAVPVTPEEQIVSAVEAYDAGATIRTGLEDNIYYEKGRLARSNAQLVARLADLCAKYDRYPATPAETRQLLHLKPDHSNGSDGCITEEA